MLLLLIDIGKTGVILRQAIPLSQAVLYNSIASFTQTVSDATVPPLPFIPLITFVPPKDTSNPDTAGRSAPHSL
jgi:hypothetical protein